MTEQRVKPAPTLRRFLRSDAFVRAVIGPLGSGKSSACVLEILRRAALQRPGADGLRHTRFAIIRNTRAQLQDTSRKTFETWVPDDICEWREQDFECRLRFDDVECEVLFRALDRPRDVRKVLSLELTGAWINEAREIPKEVFDGLQGRVGRFPSRTLGGASWFGIFADSNPWPTSHWGYELFSKQRPAGFDLFEQPDGLSADAENVENLPAGYYERLTHGKDAEWVDEYVRGRYPSSDRGSVYGELLARLEAKGRICDFEHPSDGVYVNLDLGVSDATALWFWRLNADRMPDLIDWYEASGEGMSHYFDIIESRGYRIDKIWLPHDARQRTFQTGVTTLEQFIARFGQGRVAIGPELDVDNGIAAARWLLEQPVRIHSRCAEGLRRLRAYRYAWDETKLVFSKKPLHDWTSHSSDSFRYLACVVNTVELITRPKPSPTVKPPARSLDSFHLEDLWPVPASGPRRI